MPPAAHTDPLSVLPEGPTPPPVPLPHFPSRLHAFVWRNWELVPLERMARVLGAPPDALRAFGRSMGLPEPAPIPADQWRRSYITILRRNWHLLPYEQILELLDWSAEELAFALREDDFLFVKLGRVKPACAPLRFEPPDADAIRRAERAAAIAREAFPDRERRVAAAEPLFRFVEDLSAPPEEVATPPRSPEPRLAPRYCYSYFALYGDPLLDPEADPYPDGFLARLAQAGVDGVWLQAVLYKLARFPWQPDLSEQFETRLENLRKLVERAGRHGIGVYLYLNEPRAMPLSFFERDPDLRGVTAGDHATLCTSHPDVRRYLRDSIAAICRAVPDLAAFFTITASENLTNCWSHHRGEACPRCGHRTASEVIADVNAAFRDGIVDAGARTRLIAWDWGWRDEDAPGTIAALPADVTLMSVSEWSIPIRRGGVETTIGEYSISEIGPGPRARRHWSLARERGLRTLAKIQTGNTWELSAVPYLPAVANVAEHVRRLMEANVEGLMLGWTLGGYPSPNLEVVSEMSLGEPPPTQEEAMLRVAERRFGTAAASHVADAWRAFSEAFREFPYHGAVVYNAPQQFGPANLLWERPTGYRATMIGFPYDDLEGWRAVYPPEVFIAQLERVATGFESALGALRAGLRNAPPPGEREAAALAGELRVAEAARIHFRSAANQARFVLARDALADASPAEAAALCDELASVLHGELVLARRLHDLQLEDSRIGFEASNQYYYVPRDLVEKVLNCRDLLERWLPEVRRSRVERA